MSRSLRFLLAASFAIGMLGGNCARTFAAERITAQMLYTSANGDDVKEQALALGYTMGVFDAQYSIGHCAPDEVTPLQILFMTCKYLDQYPQRMHNSADRIIGLILHANWPCEPEVDASTERETEVY
jgi:hypothetical protein